MGTLPGQSNRSRENSDQASNLFELLRDSSTLTQLLQHLDELIPEDRKIYSRVKLHKRDAKESVRIFPRISSQLQELLASVDHAQKSLDFFTAHMKLSTILRFNWIEGMKLRFQNAYLISGLIHYASVNDVGNLEKLSQSEYGSGMGQIIKLIALDARQEGSTRVLDPQYLKAAADILRRMYRLAPPTKLSVVANSLGLALRRLGERGDIKIVEEAIITLDRGLEAIETSDFTNTFATRETVSVELQNNKAIALIRMFEYSGHLDHLDESERCLMVCEDIIVRNERMFFDDPQYQLITANVYNNFGNLFKQRFFLSGSAEDARQSLTYFYRAQEYWQEKSFPYFWAIVQKNVGEVRCALGSRAGDSHELRLALHSLHDSLKYRASTSSPHQWLKSMEIVFDVLIAGGSHVFEDVLIADGWLVQSINELEALPDFAKYERRDKVLDKAAQIKAKLQPKTVKG